MSKPPTESAEVSQAFLFSCVSGLRWCDVKPLKWGNISLANRQMNISQVKTGEAVATPLNNTAITLLGESGPANANVFVLPGALPKSGPCLCKTGRSPCNN